MNSTNYKATTLCGLQPGVGREVTAFCEQLYVPSETEVNPETPAWLSQCVLCGGWQVPLVCAPHRTAPDHYERRASLNLNSVNQLIFVMVKCGVLFEVRTEFLNNI
jgi:hypothetical protein